MSTFPANAARSKEGWKMCIAEIEYTVAGTETAGTFGVFGKGMTTQIASP